MRFNLNVLPAALALSLLFNGTKGWAGIHLSPLTKEEARGRPAPSPPKKVTRTGKAPKDAGGSSFFRPVVIEIDIKIRIRATTTPIESNLSSNSNGEGANTSRNGQWTTGFLDSGPFTPTHGFLWSNTEGLVDVGVLGAPNSELESFATDVSDNAVVVGFADTGVGETDPGHAFRWIAGDGMADLGSGDGPDGNSRAYGVSSDGSVVVGQSEFPPADPLDPPGERAFRWTQAGGFQDLGSLDDGSDSIATSVTGDGSVVVGQAAGTAFRWTEAGGMVDLGFLPDFETAVATGVSDDGSIVVGVASSETMAFTGVGGALVYTPESSRAFYWTAADGMQDLAQLLEETGDDLTGITLAAATGISADGLYILGAAVTEGLEPEETIGFLASFTEELPEEVTGDYNGDGDVDGDDLADWESGFGTAAGAELDEGNGDGDQDVDGDDFLIWQQKVESGSQSGAASNAVPEPASALLLASAMLLTGISQCRTRRLCR